MHKTFVLVVFSLLLLSSNIYSCRDGRKQNHNNNMVKTYDCSVVKGVSIPINEDRGGHAGGVVDGKIIIVGGNRWSEDKGTKFFLSDALIFDDHTWVKGPELPEPIANPMFGSDSSGLYIAGGTAMELCVGKGVCIALDINQIKMGKVAGTGVGLRRMPSSMVPSTCLGEPEQWETNEQDVGLTLSDPEAGWRECELSGVEECCTPSLEAGKPIIGRIGETSPLALNDMYGDYLSGNGDIG